MEQIWLKINPESIRQVVKSHLVERHGEILTAELSDGLCKIITESLINVLSEID